MLLYIAASGALLAVLALFLFPTTGMCLALLIRPVVDATWADTLLGPYKLTDLMGVAVPVAVLTFATVRASGPQSFSRIPLLPLWVLYSVALLGSGLLLMANEGVEAGCNMLFRQINGVAAYYMGQAFFRAEGQRLLFFRVLLLATLFPLAIGLYQFATGYEWTYAQTEGIERYVGLYHDAFTVRYYMLQGILAAAVLFALAERRHVERLLLTAFVVCALLVMYRAYSKSAVATIVLWSLLWLGLRRRYLQLAALGGACLAAAALYASEITAQVGQMFHKEIGALNGDVDIDRTFAGRWYGWHDLMEQWNQLDTFSQLFGSHTAIGAHNDYLMMLMHCGAVGLLIYLLLLASIGFLLLRNALGRADPISLAGLMAYVLWCVDAIGLVPSAYPGYQWFVWGVIGLSLRLRADERRSAQRVAAQTGAVPRTVKPALAVGPQLGAQQR